MMPSQYSEKLKEKFVSVDYICSASNFSLNVSYIFELLVPFCHRMTGTFLSQNYWYLFVTELLVPFCHRITCTFLSQNYWYLFVTELLVPFCHRITCTFLSQNYWYLFVTELLVSFCHRIITGTFLSQI